MGKLRSVDLPATKVLDRTGNPLVVSAILTYCVDDTRNAALSVDGIDRYASVHALGVLKQAVSQFSYDDLKTCPHRANTLMQQQLGHVLRPVGLKIGSMSLNE